MVRLKVTAKKMGAQLRRLERTIELSEKEIECARSALIRAANTASESKEQMGAIKKNYKDLLKQIGDVEDWEQLNQSLIEEVTVEDERPVCEAVGEEKGKSDPGMREMVVYEKVIEKIVVIEEGKDGVAEVEMGASEQSVEENVAMCIVGADVEMNICEKTVEGTALWSS